MTEISQPQLNRNGEMIDEAAPTITELKRRVEVAYGELTAVVDRSAREPGRLLFRIFERDLRAALWTLGCALVVLFLARREEYLGFAELAHHEANGRRFRRAPAQARNLATLFGVVQIGRAHV